MSDKLDQWRKNLVVDGQDPMVLAHAHQVLFKCQKPGVPYPWIQIVRNNGSVYGAKIVPIVCDPKWTESMVEELEFLPALRCIGPENCSIAFIHEVRPYPALVREAAGDTLCDLPGGQVDESGIELLLAGIQEFLQEFSAEPDGIIASMPLIGVPSPTSPGAQLEAFSLHAILYKGSTQFQSESGEPETRFSIIPLRYAYQWLRWLHDGKRECVQMSAFLALLLLQQAYLERYGEVLFTTADKYRGTLEGVL